MGTIFSELTFLGQFWSFPSPDTGSREEKCCSRSHEGIPSLETLSTRPTVGRLVPPSFWRGPTRPDDAQDPNSWKQTTWHRVGHCRDEWQSIANSK